MKKLSILLLFTLLVTVGAGCTGGTSTASFDDIDIVIWRVFDDDDTFDAIIDNYRALHPNISVEYKKLRYDEYEDELIQAFAEGRGPDVLSLHNTWLPDYQVLLEPMPSSTTVSYLETQGTLRKETVVVSRTTNTMSMRELESSFVEQVAEDVVLDYQIDPDIDPVEKIYGLPMAMDTMTLFYNKDLLNAAGIATPPSTWSEFQDDIIALTTYDSDGNVDQSGAAIGTSDNVERAADILSLLMMQNGTEMTDERGRVYFHEIPKDSPEGVYPGYDATSFYTDFANPTKEVYTWNDNFDSSYESFANGETAMFFGYSYHIPLLQAAAPKLNYAIAQAPQISGGREVNFANYWVECVAAASENPEWAWNFILFATDEDQVINYLDEAQKPTALRNLIGGQLDHSLLGAFAEQILTAQSWYHGYDAAVTEDVFGDLIDTILAGTDDPENAMNSAASRISDTYNKSD
ncbi:extracellular solute-binding protein [Candidatus Uhrbacteria bacterium]|jgi:multiple sugar transport system substrate-binding protein|nr:extracellular solute-binding protein [Candidatus Uhrbacteria bacterium]MBT7717139.1 extracellular solute-binding protein [Candidatus Uhrbacteria bacterium]